MKRILVTGANGHLGANIVRSLLKRDYDVIPFVRRTSNLQGLEGLGVDYQYGDIMHVDSLVKAAEGCDAIIHSAAVYQFWVKNPNELMQPALIGTRNIFEAAHKVGIKRIIYTSTTLAVGASADPHTLRTPNDWHDEPHLPYAIAKTQAEKLAWQLSDELEIPLIVLCPSGILGPYDYNITPTTNMLRGWVNRTGVTGRGGGSFVDVRDVAEIHVQAVTEGKLGQRYIVAGDNVPIKTYGEIVSRLTSIIPKHIDIGRKTSWILGGLMEVGARLSGSTPSLTRALALELVERYHYFDCSKTKQDFDFEPRSCEEMVGDAIRWLLYLGEIEPQIESQINVRGLHPFPEKQPLS